MKLEAKSPALVLIDGFNLYHSLLKVEEKTGHRVRWLDVRQLSQLLCKRLFPGPCPYPEILFFTAHPYHKNEAHVKRQKEYYQCLKRTGVVIVTDGEWVAKDVDIRAHLELKAPWPIRWYLMWKCRTVQTHQEKGTDVSLAAHLMHLGPKANWVCVVSGDADLIPALELFRAANPNVKLGIARPYGRENRKMDTFDCTNISPEDCRACLLPNPAPTKKRNIPKPDHW